MYLSQLLVDVGANPDRPRPGRLWLRNLYRVHQRLCMAFPSDPRKQKDPAFLAPFASADFAYCGQAEAAMEPGGDVHEERTQEAGFLFRIDHRLWRCEPHGDDAAMPSPMILVLSAREPDWGYAFGLLDSAGAKGNGAHLLAAPPQVAEIVAEPEADGFRLRTRPICQNGRVKGQNQNAGLLLTPGARFRFRLNANPTRRLGSGPFAGKRVSVGRHPRVLLDWLWGRARNSGAPKKAERGLGFEPVFEPDTVMTFRDEETKWDSRWRIVTSYVHAWKKNWRKEEETLKMTFACATFDGILEVTNPALFLHALYSGIGSGKAFGFGLLSLARV